MASTTPDEFTIEIEASVDEVWRVLAVAPG